MMNNQAKVLSSVIGAMVLVACATNQTTGQKSDNQNQSQPSVVSQPLKYTRATENADVAGVAETGQKRNLIIQGSGVFLSSNMIPPPVSGLKDDPPTISLNFEQADLREIVTTIFRVLGNPYVIDPSVSGVVTINMPEDQPLKKSQLLPTLERLLAMNGAALLKEGDLYRVVPVSAAVAGNSNISSRDMPAVAGHGTRLFPLQYISAGEMVKILTPFVPQGALLQADSSRNMLMISGSPSELDALQGTIDTFDVNWLKGMSVGVFSLDSMDAETAAAQLTTLLTTGAEGQTPLSGMLRFVPLTKINSLMVITPQKAYLKDVEKWINQLDNSTGERLYVYNVENGDATYLAQVLSEVFGGSGGGISGGAGVAPGQGSSNLTSGLAGGSGGSMGGGDLGSGFNDFGSASSPSASSVSLGGSGGDLGTFGGRNVRIVADAENNALLVWAAQRDYERIIAAIRRVDRVPRQVLIEATFAEVNLKGDLQYGLQWFFKNGVGINGGDYTGGGLLGKPNFTGENLELFKGNDPGAFVYGIADSAGMLRTLLSALAKDSALNILSSPQILVVDNQEATIKVGGSVPISTGSITNNNGGLSNSNSYTYRDTGVVLHVKPKVNSSGLVTLDIAQEILTVGEAQSKVGDNPTFLQRSIESRVVVQDGQTIVLGGLISDQEQGAKTGIPVLYKIPVLGALFGSTGKNNERTELMILLTPKVIHDTTEARLATEELRARMSGLQPILQKNKR